MTQCFIPFYFYYLLSLDYYYERIFGCLLALMLGYIFSFPSVEMQKLVSC